MEIKTTWEQAKDIMDVNKSMSIMMLSKSLSNDKKWIGVKEEIAFYQYLLDTDEELIDERVRQEIADRISKLGGS